MQSPEANWLAQHELDDDSGEIHLRRVVFATGRSKAWINGRPSSLSELKELGRLLVQLYSQHSQQQLLEPPYPKHWLDRYSNFTQPVQQVKDAYANWQQTIRQHQAALDAQATRKQRIETLELQLEELEDVVQLEYKEIEQEFDRLSHHEHIMQDCSYALNALDEAEQNINQELSGLIRRLESHAGRSEQLAEIHTSILNAQSELDDATANLRQFIDRQSYDPERMEELNTQLEVFHRFARKHHWYFIAYSGFLFKNALSACQKITGCQCSDCACFRLQSRIQPKREYEFCGCFKLYSNAHAAGRSHQCSNP